MTLLWKNTANLLCHPPNDLNQLLTNSGRFAQRGGRFLLDITENRQLFGADIQSEDSIKATKFVGEGRQVLLDQQDMTATIRQQHWHPRRNQTFEFYDNELPSVNRFISSVISLEPFTIS